MDNGVVTLAGHVPSWAEKWAAERAAKHVAGVRGLANEIDVNLPSERTRSARLDAEGIEVESSGHAVTLRGRVSSWAEKDEAEETAWNAPGVSQVDNRLAVAD